MCCTFTRLSGTFWRERRRERERERDGDRKEKRRERRRRERGEERKREVGGDNLTQKHTNTPTQGNKTVQLK